MKTKNESTSQSAFFNLRVLLGLVALFAGVFLALFATANSSTEGLGSGPATPGAVQTKGTSGPSAALIFNPTLPSGSV